MMYSNDGLNQIPSVKMVPNVGSSNKDGRNHQSGSNELYKGRTFSRILDDKAAERPANVSYHTNGYTKNAMAFYNIYQTREYSYSDKVQ